jgi:prevent-host-death family protein
MVHDPFMTTVSKSQFKPRAFEYFRRVQERRETLIITERGAPVLKIMPFSEDDDADLAALRGSVLRYDDPLEPADVPWESAR